MTIKRLRAPAVHLDGWLHPDFQGVENTLREQVRNYPGGAAVCVYHRGECVVDLWGGHRDAEGTPWSQDTMAPLFDASPLLDLGLRLGEGSGALAAFGLVDLACRLHGEMATFAEAGLEGGPA